MRLVAGWAGFSSWAARWPRSRWDSAPSGCSLRASRTPRGTTPAGCWGRLAPVDRWCSPVVSMRRSKRCRRNLAIPASLARVRAARGRDGRALRIPTSAIDRRREKRTRSRTKTRTRGAHRQSVGPYRSAEAGDRLRNRCRAAVSSGAVSAPPGIRTQNLRIKSPNPIVAPVSAVF